MRSAGDDVGLSWKAPTAMNQNGNTKASATTVSTAYSAIEDPRVPVRACTVVSRAGRRDMSVLLPGAGGEHGQQSDEDHEHHADRGGHVGVRLLDALLVDEQDRCGGGAVGAAAVGEQVRLG